MRFVAAFYSLSVISVVWCRKAYQAFIPNGDRIPHPCGDDHVWGGVGHYRPGGGGPRNPFGVDFEANSMVWTVELCQKDSDGDGRTNGEELGDPNCRWSRGRPVDQSWVVTHPGICEPVDSPDCQEKNSRFRDELDCEKKKNDCPALTEPGMKTLDIRIPQTKIPPTETNYYCMLVDLPQDQEYHLAATTPIINNSEIIHHMLLFGCSESKSNYSNIPRNTPYRCGMLAHEDCVQLIGVWTVGTSVDCGSSESGFRIGKNGFKTAALQLHWNNPYFVKHHTDSSGMTVYYTPYLRKYDAELFLFGQEYLNIPPMTESIKYEATCPGDCTVDMFRQKVYITRAINHMHYLGVSQEIGLYRNGRRIKNLTYDMQYDYDSPMFYHFDPPVEMLPGDELKTTCIYKSSHKNKTVYFGQGTSDEMCYGFITYYPKQEISTGVCMNWKSVQRCRRYLPKFQRMIGSCNWTQLFDTTDPVTQILYKNMQEQCPNYATHRKCSTGCSKAAAMASQHPCLQENDIGDFIKWKLERQQTGEVLVDLLDKCLVYVSGGISVHFTNSIISFIFIIIFTIFISSFL